MKILVVDDDYEMGHAVSLILSLLDHTTDYASSARTAVKKLKINNYDLIMTDFDMPEVNGLALIEYIRSQKEWDNLPVIMFSSDPTIGDKAMQLGASGYINKPLTVDELEKVINDSVHKHHNKPY